MFKFLRLQVLKFFSDEVFGYFGGQPDGKGEDHFRAITKDAEVSSKFVSSE